MPGQDGYRGADMALKEKNGMAGGKKIEFVKVSSDATPDKAVAMTRKAVEQDKVPQHFIRMYYPIRYEEWIRKYSEKAGVDPYLAMGLILQESYYDPKAKSRVGATGLMQLMPPTAKEISGRLRVPFGASRLENPEVNIQLGTYYLKTLINTFGGNTSLAVASYNGGQGNVMKWRRAAPTRPLDELLESIPFPETRNYVKRVTILRATYSRITS